MAWSASSPRIPRRSISGLKCNFFSDRVSALLASSICGREVSLFNWLLLTFSSCSSLVEVFRAPKATITFFPLISSTSPGICCPFMRTVSPTPIGRSIAGRTILGVRCFLLFAFRAPCAVCPAPFSSGCKVCLKWSNVLRTSFVFSFSACASLISRMVRSI